MSTMEATELPVSGPSVRRGSRRERRLLSFPVAGLVLAVAALGGSITTPAQAAPFSLCTAAEVRLSAEPVRGSAGAGSYSEALTATNVSGRTCYLYGHPGV